MYNFKVKGLPQQRVPYGNTATNRWLETHREFLRWKKTPGYKKWRQAQFTKQLGLCYYCDVSLRTVRVNVEHVIPKSKGGSNYRTNLVLACSSCNKAKGSTKLTDSERTLLNDKHTSKTKFKHQLREAEVAFALELRERVRDS